MLSFKFRVNFKFLLYSLLFLLLSDKYYYLNNHETANGSLSFAIPVLSNWFRLYHTSKLKILLLVQCPQRDIDQDILRPLGREGKNQGSHRPAGTVGN